MAAGCDLHENSVLPDFEIAHSPKIIFIDGKSNSGDNGNHFGGEKGSRRKSLGPGNEQSMLDWKTRCTATVLIAYSLVWLMGCGASTSDISITPPAVVLLPGQTFQFNIARTGSAASEQPLPALVVNGAAGGSAATGTITPGGLYTAPSTAPGQKITVGIQGQSSSAQVTLLNPGSIAPGSVAATKNPLVASYSLTVPAATPVQVQFGLDTSYGFSTSAVQNPTGGAVTVLVAGMRADTAYHMQAVLDLANGSKVLDADHVFTTGSLPAGRIPDITVQVTGTGTPSPGVELLSMESLVSGQTLLSAVAADLEGNVIWYYDLGTSNALPIKPLPNGHYLVLAAPPAAAAGVGNDIQEIDLAGNVITDLSLSTVSAAVSGIFGAQQLSTLHHDVAALPNGHWILLVNYDLTINNVAVGGDALVDWDPQKGPVWTWSTFDHLPLSHAPYGLTDWTHSNAVVYSPTDGNLILSMRNQNWVIKINYDNGAGDGSILWTLGDGGSFTLPPGQAPIEWNYGQHYPTFVSPNSAGVISLMVFNDGNNRLMDSNNDVCGTPGVGACYSSVPIYQLDESAKTATVLWEANLSPYFSLCCGDALILPNGDMEVDIAFDQTVTPGYSDIEEFTQTQTPELVWEMQIYNQLAYRGMRIPSLYPDQVWPATLQSDPHRVQPAGSPSNNGRDLR
jgi:arylsulfate sulfotransferase